MKPSIQLVSSTRKTIRLVLGLSLVTNLAILGLPMYSLQIFDRVLTSTSMETLWMLFTAVTVIAVTAIFFEYMRNLVVQKFSLYLDQQIFPVLMSRQGRSQYHHQSRQLFSDYNHAQKKLTDGSLFILVDAMMSPLFITMIFFIHPILGVFMLFINSIAAMAVILKWKWLLPRHAQKEERRTSEQNKLISNENTLLWLERTSNSAAWLTYRKASWKLLQQEQSDRYNPANFIHNLYASMKWIAQIGLPTIGATLLLSNQVSIGGFIAGLIIGSKAVIPLEGILHNLGSYLRIRSFLNQLKTIIDDEQQHEAAYATRLHGKVEIDAMKLVCPGNRHEGGQAPFNLIVNPGEIVTILGPAGSGQDSIVRNLLHPGDQQEGVVTYDDVRIEDWDEAHLKNQVGFVGATSLLPSESIRALITSFETVPFSDAVEAAHRTGLNQRLIDLGISYADTLDNSSMKQVSYRALAHLVALTSAVARKPAVYIMENPEMFLDIESLKKLRTVLLEERGQGKTILLTSYSKGLLEISDQAILLANGKAIYKGKPENLPARETQTGSRAKITQLANSMAGA